VKRRSARFDVINLTLHRKRNRMRIVPLVSILCLAGYATTAAQQTATPPPAPKPARQHAAARLKLKDVAGTWSFESTVKNAAGNDTTVNSELVATATRKGWVTNLAGRDAIPTRVVAVAGDSVVLSAGPYESILRAGQQVRLRETLHFKGDDASGTMVAHYSNGAVVKGSVKGSRKK
jgi:hypothetical protein